MKELNIEISGAAGAGKSSLAIFLSDLLEQNEFEVDLKLNDCNESNLRKSAYCIITSLCRDTKINIIEKQTSREDNVLYPFSYTNSCNGKYINIIKNNGMIMLNSKHLSLFISMLKVHIGDKLLLSDVVSTKKYNVLQRDSNNTIIHRTCNGEWDSKYAITKKEEGFCTLYGLDDGDNIKVEKAYIPRMIKELESML